MSINARTVTTVYQESRFTKFSAVLDNLELARTDFRYMDTEGNWRDIDPVGDNDIAGLSNLADMINAFLAEYYKATQPEVGPK